MKKNNRLLYIFIFQFIYLNINKCTNISTGNSKILTNISRYKKINEEKDADSERSSFIKILRKIFYFFCFNIRRVKSEFCKNLNEEVTIKYINNPNGSKDRSSKIGISWLQYEHDDSIFFEKKVEVVLPLFFIEKTKEKLEPVKEKEITLNKKEITNPILIQTTFCIFYLDNDKIKLSLCTSIEEVASFLNNIKNNLNITKVTIVTNDPYCFDSEKKIELVAKKIYDKKKGTHDKKKAAIDKEFEKGTLTGLFEGNYSETLASLRIASGLSIEAYYFNSKSAMKYDSSGAKHTYNFNSDLNFKIEYDNKNIKFKSENDKAFNLYKINLPDDQIVDLKKVKNDIFEKKNPSEKLMNSNNKVEFLNYN